MFTQALFFLFCLLNINNCDAIANLHARKFLSLLRLRQTGIKVSKEAVEEVAKFNCNKPVYEYVVLHIDDKLNKVVPDVHPDVGSSLEMSEYKDFKEYPASYKRLRDYMLAKASAYVFYCFGGKKVMIAWCNDNKANITQKMKFSGTKDEVKNAISASTVIQANDADDLAYETLIKDIFKGKGISK